MKHNEYTICKIKIPKVKYLHILWHNGVFFNQQFVDMISGENEFFDLNEHVFITPHLDLYKVINHIKNVFFVPDGNLIKKYGELADWIFVHSLNCKWSTFVFTPKRYANKVIWRTWGHDVVGKRIPHGSKIDNAIRSVIRYPIVKLHQHKVSQFYAVGVANDVDTIKINSIWKKMRIFQISYSYAPGRYEIMNNLLKQEKANGNGQVHVMVGHSSSEGDRHIEILEKIRKFANKNIIIHLFLYGAIESPYVKKVIKTAHEYFYENVVVHSEFVPYEDFAKCLLQMDVAILAGKTSSALGTLQALLFLRKKVYVDSKGDIANAIRYNSILPYTIDEIAKTDFVEFCKNDVLIANSLKETLGQIQSRDESCLEFLHLLECLNKDGQ